MSSRAIASSSQRANCANGSASRLASSSGLSANTGRCVSIGRSFKTLRNFSGGEAGEEGGEQQHAAGEREREARVDALLLPHGIERDAAERRVQLSGIRRLRVRPGAG